MVFYETELNPNFLIERKKNKSFQKRWKQNYQNQTLCKTEMAGDDRDDSSAQV